MWNWLTGLFTGGIGATAQGVSRAVATFTGDKVQRETNVHDETMQVHQTYAAEYMAQRANRTWWDSLWDGLNRAPRPLMAFGVIALLVWPIFEPVQYAAAMQAYALVPEWLAGVFVAIVAFYFTARHLEKRIEMKGPTPEQVQAVLDTQKRIDDMSRPVTDEQYNREMSDNDTPLSDDVIAEWNRRRGN